MSGRFVTAACTSLEQDFALELPITKDSITVARKWAKMSPWQLYLENKGGTPIYRKIGLAILPSTYGH